MEAAGLTKYYRESDHTVRGVFDHDQAGASEYYRRYVEFASSFAPCSAATMLDLGCGSGWATLGLRAAGHRAIGVDVHSIPEAKEAELSLPFVSADAAELPFRDSSVDMVGMHAVLEHLPNPEKVLREALRVLKPGGRLVVVGPNLLSVGLATRYVAKESWKTIRRGGRWEPRTENMPRHPFGNTLPEVLQHLAHHTWHTIAKLLGERPVKFLNRAPDLRAQSHADNDASYFCNPMDLLLWAQQTGSARAIRWWGDQSGFSRILWPIWGGTWIVLEKKAL